eukprot:gnl/TRDRNA2_/TRDRNA2_168292_c0_seq2.p1 gnl/TRDRNA2_/TRDRNA2_168292_c0~~gnl/TRDRNA2_/TRDRNA2_168292_c0_seq2.p1  ORF type:complete len:417 (+),score=49.98 gnl/TRDRNA2_/TRDRNA2_168292_c0_seq2:26-1252(+)
MASTDPLLQRRTPAEAEGATTQEPARPSRWKKVAGTLFVVVGYLLVLLGIFAPPYLLVEFVGHIEADAVLPSARRERCLLLAVMLGRILMLVYTWLLLRSALQFDPRSRIQSARIILVDIPLVIADLFLDKHLWRTGTRIQAVCAACPVVIICWTFARQLRLSCYEALTAAEDPSRWPGVEEITTTGFAEGMAPVRCSACHQEIQGVLCYSKGRCMHFGCAPSTTQDVAVTTFAVNEDASEMLQNFHDTCRRRKDMYPFGLSVERMFAITDSIHGSRYEEAQNGLISSNPNIKRLYHGTSCMGAKAIIAEGFKLPTWSGMFGRGIYFADVPLKSWQYSNSQYLLVCDVALGQVKEMRTAAPGFRPDACDSVVGTSFGQGGSLRLPEYVVYKPQQVLPKYLLRVRQLTS